MEIIGILADVITVIADIAVIILILKNWKKRK